MNLNKTARIVSVFIVIAVAVIFAFPLDEKINLGLDLQGGSHVILECKDSPNALVDDDAVNRVLEVIRNRVDQLGVSEPVIQRQGNNRILVQLPGIDDPEAAVDLIGKTALLEFKDEEGETLMTGAHLLNAKETFDQFGRPIITIEFDKTGATEFSKATSSNVGKVLAITLDDKEISAPVVQEPILDGQARITGSFTVDSAKRLALLLRSGSLPVKVEILENRSVGPSLGKDSIDKGIKAGLIGLILILVFMVVYYKKFGLIADFALMICMLIIIGALAGFKATLTLPGIAGMILTIGMAVDANILIFERIKEELKLGKTFRASI
ncbi:MAG: protein translocase subunit SecD, partial [Candidatus Atribacteria bacterium]|nr:protein translocase subunit SecD [Candidatus Atribacteria bacterium]